MAILHAEHSISTPKYIFRFCVGSYNFSLDHSHETKDEQKDHGDLVFVNSPDFDNQFWGDITIHGQSATTIKVLAAIDWAVRTYDFQYLVRLGDDSYFRPENFFAKVHAGLMPTRSACIGYKVPALRKYDPAGQLMAPYPSGMGFVLTHDVASWLTQASSQLLLGGPEDAVVGSWFVRTRVHLYHVPNGFRDLDWSCQYGEDILVHCLREQAHWNLIGPDGNLPC